MFNLILKDILIQRKMFLFGVVYIMIMIIAFQKVGSPMFAASVVALSYVMTLSACAYDDKNKSDILFNSLPLKKYKIVLSRYLSVYVFAVLSIIYYVVIISGINFLGLPFSTYSVTIEGIVGAFFALSLINGIYFPVFFKLGYIKSKIINFIIFFGFFFGFGTLVPVIVENKNIIISQGFIKFISNQSDIQVLLGIMFITIVVLFISFLISLKLYNSKEFS